MFHKAQAAVICITKRAFLSKPLWQVPNAKLTTGQKQDHAQHRPGIDLEQSFNLAAEEDGEHEHGRAQDYQRAAGAGAEA
jgi:hypothetical protein